MASRIQGITVEIGGDTTKLSKALEDVNKSIKGTQSGLKDVNKLLKLDPTNTELVVQKQKMLKDAIEATKEKLATLKTAAQQANEQLANGEITQQQYDALQREIAETEQNLKSLQDQAATTNATLAKIDEAGEKLQNLGSSVENVGKKFLPVTAAVTGLGTAAVKTAADFDVEMSKVSAISGATGDDFDQLRAKAREMGAKTKFSASEAASAMEYMAMAGWKTSDMLGGIKGIMNLAAASGEDLATTSDIVTDALTAFGLSASDSGHFADILAAASSNANTNVSMMGETFKYCAPIAGALGFSAEDTAEAIGLMANSGIKASQAGTSLRSIMNNLSGEVTFVGKNIGEVTIATSNADGSMRSLNDILADCRVAFSGLTESEKASNAEALVGKNAMSGFLALMNSSESDINKLRGAIENCDGASESMAETMQDNLNGQLTILKSQLEELAISFGDILMPTIRKIVSVVQQFVDKLNSMDESTRETIIKIGLLAASIGPLLIVLGKTISTVGTAMRGFSSLAKGVRLLITHVGSASGVFSKLGAVLGGLSGPVVAVVAVIGTLVAAFMNLWNTNEEFRTAITGIWNDIVSKVKDFCDQLTQRINGLGFDFKDVTEVLKAAWDGFCQVLAPLFEGAFQNIATILGVVLDTLLGLFDVFSNVFSGNWSGAWEAAKGIFSSIWDGVKSIFSTTLTALKSALDVFLGLFGTDWQTVWGSIKSFFETVWSGISSFFSSTVSAIQSVATTVFTAVSGFFTTVLTSIQTAFSTIWTAISTAVSSVLNTIHTTVTTVWTAISTTITAVMNTISTTITTVWNGIYNTIKPLLDAFKYLFETIWQAIQILISRALTAIQSEITSIWNAIVAFVTPLLTALQTTFSTVWTAIEATIATVLSVIQTAVTTVWNAIVSFLSTLLTGIQTRMSTAWNAIQAVISTVLSAIHSIVSSIWSAMARKSRRQQEQQQTLSKNVKTLQTAAYCRLSVEDKELESISTQIMLVQEFIRSQPDMSLANTYVDNGVTGTKFDRPEWNRLMGDVRSGKIQCIVVKDLSRFGRDYLEAGYYIENIFPKLHVRFVAITDHFDSMRPEDMESISIPVKNMVNAMYAKDTSKKIRAVRQGIMEKGERLGNTPPLGYRYPEGRKEQLVVDEETAGIIRMIFYWASIGIGKIEIAKRLTFLQIPSPRQWQRNRSNGTPMEPALPWIPSSLDRILINRAYCGDTVTGMTRTKMHKCRKMDESDWYVTMNTHEPIINRAFFERVQETIHSSK